jgi:hypothetical protein
VQRVGILGKLWFYDASGYLRPKVSNYDVHENVKEAFRFNTEKQERESSMKSYERAMSLYVMLRSKRMFRWKVLD